MKISASYQRFVLIFSFLVMLACANAAVSTETAKEYEAKTALIINLALFTAWPGESFDNPRTPINLCVTGNEAVLQAFNKISRKMIGQRSISVTDISRSKKTEHCHIIFLGNEDRLETARIQNAALENPILTIDDMNGLTSFKSIVNLQKNNDKIILNINLDLAKRSRLKISSRVLKLANIVPYK